MVRKLHSMVGRRHRRDGIIMSNARRDFLRQLSLLAGGLAAPPLLRRYAAGAQAAAPAGPAAAGLPRRVLGRTGQKVSLIGIGMGPQGSGNTSAADTERTVGTALDLGINYVDVSPDYGNAESKLKGVLKTRRNEVFLVTKVNPQRQDKEGVQRQLEESLQRMGVQHVDAVHIHNLGDFDMNRVLTPDGALAGLQEAQRRGLTRFIGTSGHMRPPRFVKLLETGAIDLTMNALNFADRHNYDFEGLVLPAAKQQGTAVVAMKVLGGAIGWRYDGHTRGNFADHYEASLRYSLGLPGVACAVIGLANEDEVRYAVKTAQAYTPLPEAQTAALLEAGRQLAAGRSRYYGPIDG